MQTKDGFEAQCDCSRWIGAADLVGRWCRECGYAICLPGHCMRRRFVECETCRDEVERARPKTTPAPAEAGAGSGTRTNVETDTIARRPAKLVTRRQVRNYRQRPTEFAPAEGSAAEQLVMLTPAVERVFLTGDLPSSWLAWIGELPEGWTNGAHYLDGHNPVLRFEREGGRPVEIHQAAEWFGSGPLDPAACALAWAELGALIAHEFDQGMLLATPSATGRYLIQRSVPEGRGWGVLPDDLQELIRSTSGQGRIELLDGPHDIDQLHEYDGRLMYGALAWGLGALAEGEHVTHDRGDEYAGQTRGRYRIRFTVPVRWEGPGLCGVPGEDKWEYPSAPGKTGETWVDGAELGLMLAQGWTVKILERLLFPAYKGKGPLDEWARKLCAIRLEANARGLIGMTDGHPELVSAAVRAILIHGIGALHGRPHKVTRIGTLSDMPDGAADWRVDEAGQHLWSETLAQAMPWMAHPEWSTAIWARARLRLLDGPPGLKGDGRTGALHLPPGSVVAFRTDAIYTTHDPGWHDNGQPGRFRLVWSRTGPMQRPQSWRQLDQLKEQVTANA